jgi:phosphoserine aminotransferase
MFEPIMIPAHLLPSDGRFGSGPSKVRGPQLDALMAAQPTLLGTSHRQAPVKDLVGDVRSMLATLFDVPDGYEVILGNGGSTMFWDAAAFGLVDNKAQHAAFGEFGQKFAKATLAAPYLEASSIRTAQPGAVILPTAEEGVDVYAWPHNETSTGAMVEVLRPGEIGDALTVVDGTSAAGGLFLDTRQADVYYFAPQKSFASDGGIWFALVSPAAIERIERIAASGRYIPESLSLQAALTNSRVNQTLNTPAVSTLVLMRAQLEWMLAGGGMDFVTNRTSQSARIIYEWADSRAWAEAFVTEPSNRSNVVATIGLVDTVDSSHLRQHLRANGVVDVDPYRKLGLNQIRVGMFPAVDPEDVSALTHSLDYLVERLLT